MLLDRKKNDRKLISLSPQSIVPSPFQPRREFDYYELLELSSSIQQNGIIQPLTVRRRGERYELISGERRLKAAIIAGFKVVPCILVNAGDRECSLMCLIENIQRTDLTFFEEADGIKRLMDEFSLSQQEVAEKLSMAQSTLSNKLRLLKLSPEIQTRIISSGLTERHARALLRLPVEKREDTLDKIIADGLNLAQSEALIESILNPDIKTEPIKASAPQKPVRKAAIGDIKLFSNSLSKLLCTMQNAGISANSRKHETEKYIEYKVRIFKNSPQYDQLKIC